MLEIEEPMNNLQKRENRSSKKNNEVREGLTPQLYCIEIQDQLVRDKNKETEKVSDKEQEISSLYFISEFWKALRYRESACVNFLCMAPLISTLPFISNTGPYHNHILMVIFCLYYSIGILFIKNIVSWCVSLRHLRRTYKRKTITEVFTPLHVVMNSIMCAVVFLGIFIISRSIAISDRNLNLVEEDSILKHTLEKREIGLIPFLTEKIHPFNGVIFMYVVIITAILFIFLTDQIKSERNEDPPQRTSFKRKVCIILCAISIVLIERHIINAKNTKTSYFKNIKPNIVFILLMCTFFGINVLFQEIKKGKIVLPKTVTASPNMVKEAAELIGSLFSSSLILGVSWFILYDLGKNEL